MYVQHEPSRSFPQDTIAPRCNSNIPFFVAADCDLPPQDPVPPNRGMHHWLRSYTIIVMVLLTMEMLTFS